MLFPLALAVHDSTMRFAGSSGIVFPRAGTAEYVENLGRPPVHVLLLVARAETFSNMFMQLAMLFLAINQHDSGVFVKQRVVRWHRDLSVWPVSLRYNHRDDPLSW